ncbi:hypothetical protein SPRG_18744, partial [Saprolegnia parasitica CBS 223.65]
PRRSARNRRLSRRCEAAQFKGAAADLTIQKFGSDAFTVDARIDEVEIAPLASRTAFGEPPRLTRGAAVTWAFFP